MAVEVGSRWRIWGALRTVEQVDLVGARVLLSPLPHSTSKGDWVTEYALTRLGILVKQRDAKHRNLMHRRRYYRRRLAEGHDVAQKIADIEEELWG